jgi:hypothetical protein
MLAGYTKSYMHVQGVEEFYHCCYGYHNKVRRSFRYVPGHGWSECGKRHNKPHYDKSTKDRIESLLWHIIYATSEQAAAASDRNLSEADKWHTDVCKTRNELYEILGMEEYKYDL